MLRLVDLPQGGLSGRKRNCCDLGAQHLQNVTVLFARAVGVTHSAASQTAAQMARAGVIVFLFPAFTGYRARGIAAGSGGAKGKP
jgi:hypothetical protein